MSLLPSLSKELRSVGLGLQCTLLEQPLEAGKRGQELSEHGLHKTCLISVCGVCAHVLVVKPWSWKCFLLFNGSCRRFCKTQAGYCLYLK